jgi:hypothetical protein
VATPPPAEHLPLCIIFTTKINARCSTLEGIINSNVFHVLLAHVNDEFVYRNED